jgi:hypothetical protein
MHALSHGRELELAQWVHVAWTAQNAPSSIGAQFSAGILPCDAAVWTARPAVAIGWLFGTKLNRTHLWFSDLDKGVQVNGLVC